MSSTAEVLYGAAGLPLQSPTELLGNADCLPISAELTEFENNFFGPDFTWSPETTETWLRSGSAFYAAVVESHGAASTPPDKRRKVIALASILLTGNRSCEQLLQGEITEQQLAPWFLESPDTAPVFYFSSLVSNSTEHLLALYGKLLSEVESYVQASALRVYAGFSIATGPVGLQHLSKNGFMRVEGAKYLQKYDFMRIDAFTAKTVFWSRILSSGPLDGQSAKVVEARLSQSKAERHRELCGSRPVLPCIHTAFPLSKVPPP